MKVVNLPLYKDPPYISPYFCGRRVSLISGGLLYTLQVINRFGLLWNKIWQQQTKHPPESDESESACLSSTSGVELPLSRSIFRSRLIEARFIRITRTRSSEACLLCPCFLLCSSTFDILMVRTIGVRCRVFVWIAKSCSNWRTSFIGSHGRKLGEGEVFCLIFEHLSQILCCTCIIPWRECCSWKPYFNGFYMFN